MYLVTKQFGVSSPFKWELVESREEAAFRAMDLSGLKAPPDLDEWKHRQGNQHKPTRWRYHYRSQAGRPVNMCIRKFNV